MTHQNGLATSVARMRQLLEDLSEDFAGATEGSPEMARLQQIEDAVAAYDAAVASAGSSTFYAFTSTVAGPLDEYSGLLVRLVLAVQKSDLDRMGASTPEVRGEVRSIGEAIFEKFGAHAMSTANNALFEISGKASSRVDKWWDGVGYWMA